MIKFIKEYEVQKPKQHLVWMSAASDEPGNSALFGSPADVISPSSSESTGWTYRTNPPAADGKKIIINDTDHLDGKTVAPELVWKSFTRGIHLIIIDGGLNGFDWPYNPEVRPAMSQTRSYAERMNLAVMAPQPNLSSTSYVLANPGSEYLIYQPGSGSFTVELKKNKYKYEWFNPLTVRIVQNGTLSAGDGKREFSPPFSGQAVLYLKSSELQ